MKCSAVFTKEQDANLNHIIRMNKTMSLVTKLTLIVTLVLSIMIPFGYFLLEKKIKNVIKEQLERMYFSSLELL